MSYKICSVNGCDSKHYSKGYCRKHYRKFTKYGNPLVTKLPRRDPICLVNGCQKRQTGLGYCPMHYRRLKLYGDPCAPNRYDFIRRDHYDVYKIWKGMRDRCNRPKNEKYKDYGGRGIKVCDRWSGPHGAKYFYEDMGERPGLEYSIDRIGVDGDYEPSNCRWATPKQQANNKRQKITSQHCE